MKLERDDNLDVWRRVKAKQTPRHFHRVGAYIGLTWLAVIATIFLGMALFGR